MAAEIKFKNGYFKAPNDIFDEELTLYEKVVYLYLCRCSNNSTAFPSYNTIANKCSISRRKAIDVVSTLQEKGFLKKYYRTNENFESQSNVYEIIPPGAQHAPRSAGDSPLSEQDAPNKELDYKELENKELKNIYILSNERDGIFSYYSKKYKERFGEEHPTMNEEKMNELRSMYYELSSELDIEEERWIDLVDHHFNNLSPKNNGNILSFLAPNGGHSCIYRYLEETEDSWLPF